MKTYTRKELDEILHDHARWLKDPKTGKRADLSGSNLSGSDLRRSNLSGSKWPTTWHRIHKT